MIIMQECLQLLQLLHTELSGSKEQVKKLELQLQQLQVCNLHIELCSLCTYINYSYRTEGNFGAGKIWRMATDSPNYYSPNFSSF